MTVKQQQCSSKLLCHLILLLSFLSLITAEINCKNSNKSTFLWSVETERGARAYLFGTIHEPFTKIWSYVSAKVKEALEQSDSLVVEVDVSNKAKVDALLNCMQMTVGNTVRDYLPQAVYIRLRQYLRHYRQNLINWYMAKGEAKKMAKIHAFSTFANMTRGWERRKPLWLLILLQQLEFKNPELSPPLDFYLAAYAKNTDKSIYTVETIDEQCEPLRSVDNDSVIFAINYTLSYLEYLSRKSKQNKRQQQQPALGSHAAIINHYQCGDMNIHSLISSGTNQTNRIGFSLGYNSDQKAEQIGKKFFTDIMLQRNIRIAERIIEFLETKEDNRHFIALGLGHLIGENSVVQYLTDYGYAVQPVTEIDNIFYPQTKLNKKFKKFNELWIRRSPLETEGAKPIITVTILPSTSSTTAQTFVEQLLIAAILIVWNLS